MLKLVLMITIVNRSKGEKVISFFNQNKVPMTLGRYGKGTATAEMMSYLGIAEKEKYVLFSTLPLTSAIYLSEKIKSNVHIKGELYSILVPISSVGGKETMSYISGDIPKDQEFTIKYDYDSELIVVVANRGYVDMVMDAARKAGATGGTVIHARGTGIDSSEKFFGVTIGAEKEMIFVVAVKEKRNEIMKTIMDEAGANSKAGSLLFSLPVKQYLN